MLSGYQGLQWYSEKLMMDEDGDVAQEFLDEVVSHASGSHSGYTRSLPSFKTKVKTRPARLKGPVRTYDGNVVQPVLIWSKRLATDSLTSQDSLSLFARCFLYPTTYNFRNISAFPPQFIVKWEAESYKGRISPFRLSVCINKRDSFVHLVNFPYWTANKGLFMSFDLMRAIPDYIPPLLPRPSLRSCDTWFYVQGSATNWLFQLPFWMVRQDALKTDLTRVSFTVQMIINKL